MSSFGAELGVALIELREMAESRMRSQIKITRIAVDEFGNPVQVTTPDGDVTEERVTVYTGKARIHYPGTPWPSTPDVGGAEVTIRPIFTSIPIGAVLPLGALEVGDLVNVVSDLDTPALAGDVYRVIEPGNASQETAQRVLCQHYGAGVAS